MVEKVKKKPLFQRAIEYDEAMITSLIRYGESDCIVRLFCRERGRVSAFVRNGLKPSRTRGGIIHAPARVRVGLRSSPHASLLRVVELDSAPSTLALSRSLKAIGWSCYLVELIEVFLPEHESMPVVFGLLDEALSVVGQGKEDPVLLRAFELKLLRACGYLPDLQRVVEGQDRVARAYSPQEGLFFSEPHDMTVAFDETARQIAMVLLDASLCALPLCDTGVLRMVSQIFAWRLREQATRPLRSVAFLKEIGV